ncbi:hypothetical protein L6V77_01855 [Myxococcota bacterium]|nr:hypothetical protein [Myxococcota bacterium]
MPIQVPQRVPLESAAELALGLADSLQAQGDRQTARAVLELIEPVERDDRLTVRLADDALERGDAARALRLLVRAWESGSLDSHIESRLALAALALGLSDVVEALTDAPERSLEHTVVRLIHAAQRGERVEVSGHGSPTEVVFALRSHLRILSTCGRDDLVDAVGRASLGLPGIERALAGLPRTPAATHELVKVPLDQARAAFARHWQGPGGQAAANWQWAVAREIGVGETVLVLSPWPEALRTVLGHARVVSVGPAPGPGVEIVAEPEALPIGAGRFQHVIAADWLGRSLNPDAAMRELARVLAHDGQCHALCAGAAAPGDAALTFSTAALQKLAVRAGLLEVHTLARKASGLPAETVEAEVTLLRAVRRVV